MAMLVVLSAVNRHEAARPLGDLKGGHGTVNDMAPANAVRSTGRNIDTHATARSWTITRNQ